MIVIRGTELFLVQSDFSGLSSTNWTKCTLASLIVLNKSFRLQNFSLEAVWKNIVTIQWETVNRLLWRCFASLPIYNFHEIFRTNKTSIWNILKLSTESPFGDFVRFSLLQFSEISRNYLLKFLNGLPENNWFLLERTSRISLWESVEASTQIKTRFRALPYLLNHLCFEAPVK